MSRRRRRHQQAATDSDPPSPLVGQRASSATALWDRRIRRKFILHVVKPSTTGKRRPPSAKRVQTVAVYLSNNRGATWSGAKHAASKNPSDDKTTIIDAQPTRDSRQSMESRAVFNDIARTSFPLLACGRVQARLTFVTVDDIRNDLHIYCYNQTTPTLAAMLHSTGTTETKMKLKTTVGSQHSESTGVDNDKGGVGRLLGCHPHRWYHGHRLC